MNDRSRKRLHAIVRNSIALTFWAHAFGVTRLLPFISAWNHIPSVPLLQIAIICAILFYSYVPRHYGWSVLIDTLYVYVSPLVWTGRITWGGAKGVWRAITKVSPPLKQMFDLPKSKPSESGATLEGHEEEKASRFEVLFAPFLHFSLLWCLLIALSRQRPILYLALTALLLIAGRAVIGLHTTLEDSVSAIKKFDDRMKIVVEKMADEVAQTSPAAAEFKQRVLNIRLYSGVFGYFMSSDSVKKVTRRFSIALSAPAYIYTSLLCGFAYYDISVLQGGHWKLWEALVDSLYMPIAFTDLPHSFPIRLLGGIQVASLILIGYDAIFRSIDERMKSISQAAQGFSNIIQSEKVAAALKVYDAQQANQKVATPS